MSNGVVAVDVSGPVCVDVARLQCLDRFFDGLNHFEDRTLIEPLIGEADDLDALNAQGLAALRACSAVSNPASSGDSYRNDMFSHKIRT